MGWFDEQIRQRMQSDDDAFEESFLKMAGAVMGRRFRAADDDMSAARNAIEDILRFHKIKVTDIPGETGDINEQIEHILRPHGIMRRNVTLEKGWHNDAFGAMLGKRTDTGAVTSLIPKRTGGYTYFDEVSGQRVNITRANEGIIDRDAMAFYMPFPLKKMGMGDLLRYTAGLIEFSDVVCFGIFSLAAVLIGLLIAKINHLIFFDVAGSGSVRALTAAAVFMLCTMLSMMLIGTVKDLIGTRINTKMQLCVEAAAMMRILSLPAAFFKKYSSGDLSYRSQQINSLCRMMVDSVMSVGLTGIFSLVYVGQIFFYAPALALPSLMILGTTVVIGIITSLWQMKISRRRMELAGRENGMSFAFISGIRKIKLAGAEKRAFARWGSVYADMAEKIYDPPAFLKLNTVITTAIDIIGTIFIYYTAVKNGVTVADYMAFNAAFGMVSGAFYALAGIAMTVSEIKPVLERCRPIMETEPEISGSKRTVTRLSGGIEINNVTFGYSEDMPPVLDNISLKIRPGQYVAIVGKTGCGKSTLTRILLGFEKPVKGAVYYDGHDLASLELSSLRRRIGTVMQNGKLMQGDIYSNIVVSAPWLTIDDAWEAAELAGIADDIRDMPMGMFTVISEGQGGISGGQRQRLMIARAVAPGPKILILDEATSALDNVTQSKISEALGSLKCTRIVVAHRLSTIRRCDRIIVLDGGHIIGDGTYDELIENNDFFAKLVERQRIDRD